MGSCTLSSYKSDVKDNKVDIFSVFTTCSPLIKNTYKMKLLQLLFVGINATFNQMIGDFKAQFDVLPSDTRALIQSDMGLLNKYGCWCYFEDDHGKGKSQPVDDIDKFCKNLHDGYTCILKDHNNACTPWAVPYNSAVSIGILSGMTMENLIIECNSQNTPDSCESRSCIVEGWFVVQFFQYAVNGGQVNSAFQHSNNFDPSAECVTGPPVYS